jgi:hypothetical protein
MKDKLIAMITTWLDTLTPCQPQQLQIELPSFDVANPNTPIVVLEQTAPPR